jgi:hypothetical protein
MQDSIKEIEKNISGVLNDELICEMNKKYNELLEIQKKEILGAISNIDLQSDNFMRDYDANDKIETDFIIEIESKNFTIELILTEVGKWKNEEFEFEFLDIKNICVEDEQCKEVNVDYIKNEEILKYINY